MPTPSDDDDAVAESGARDGADADSSATAAGPGPAAADDNEPRGPGGLDRRTLIRLLVGLGIGIPILIEAGTLLGIIRDQFGGDGGDTATPTPTDTGVGVGEELLPDTPATDEIAAAYVAADGWTFTMSVAVQNTTDRIYELRLDTVTTADGTTVEGGGESGPIDPGESGSVTGRWDLPEGSSPETVEVRAIARNGTVTRVERTVELGSVPVQGG